MNNITELANLRGLAEAATPGPHHIYTHPRDDNNHKSNEAWHAACEPQAIIGLIDALEAAQAEVARFTKALSIEQTISDGAAEQAEKLIEQRDSALARLAELEQQEPISWTVAGDIQNWSKDFSKYKTQHYTRPVYAAAGASPVQPSQAGELSDEEILRHWARRDKCLHGRNAVIWFARAVIRAAINTKELK